MSLHRTMKPCHWVRMLCRLTKREYSVSIRARSKRRFLTTTLIPSSGVVTVILPKVSWILTESLLQTMNFVLLADWYINAPMRTLIQEKQICLLKTVMRYLQSLWMNNISPNILASKERCCNMIWLALQQKIISEF